MPQVLAAKPRQGDSESKECIAEQPRTGILGHCAHEPGVNGLAARAVHEMDKQPEMVSPLLTRGVLA